MRAVEPSNTNYPLLIRFFSLQYFSKSYMFSLVGSIVLVAD